MYSVKKERERKAAGAKSRSQLGLYLLEPQSWSSWKRRKRGKSVEIRAKALENSRRKKCRGDEPGDLRRVWPFRRERRTSDLRTEKVWRPKSGFYELSGKKRQAVVFAEKLRKNIPPAFDAKKRKKMKGKKERRKAEIIYRVASESRLIWQPLGPTKKSYLSWFLCFTTYKCY